MFWQPPACAEWRTFFVFGAGTRRAAKAAARPAVWLHPGLIVSPAEVALPLRQETADEGRCQDESCPIRHIGPGDDGRNGNITFCIGHDLGHQRRRRRRRRRRRNGSSFVAHADTADTAALAAHTAAFCLSFYNDVADFMVSFPR